MNKEITNIRYGEPGKILFDFSGETHTIKEPIDVILVGTDIKLAAKWIWDKYSWLLIGGLAVCEGDVNR